MTLLAVNGWDVSNYIMGALAMIGPWFILWWWISTVRHRFRELNEAHRARQQQDEG